MGKFVFGLLVVLVICSCGPDIEVFIPNAGPDTSGNVTQLTSKLRQDLAGDIDYQVSCPCFGNATFQLDKDLTLVIPAGFVDLNQHPCTNGHFDLHVTVCDTKGEILLAGIPTLSEHQLLNSRIELNLSIRDQDQIISLAHGKSVRILVDDPDPLERMELFYGNDDGTAWIQADGNPDTWASVMNADWWIQSDSSSTPISGFGYECFSDSTDWINVDVFVNVPESQRTPVCVQLPEGFSNTNTAVFMAFRDYNSIVHLPGNPDTKQFCESYGATPLGFHVTFIVMAEKGDGQYFFAAKDAVVTDHLTEAITPLKTPYEEIRNYLKAL